MNNNHFRLQFLFYKKDIAESIKKGKLFYVK